MIDFQYKFFPVIQELMNFTPNTKPVLKNGSINWQNKLNQFSKVPPKELLPKQLDQLHSFLVREDSNGLFINNLPISIIPKIDNLKLVNAEYIEEDELYLISDIDIPNTNLIDRYYELRKSHPFTKNTELTCVNNMNELLNELEKEQVIFNNFLKESDFTKIRWYPKCSFLLKDISDDFKKELTNYSLIISPLCKNVRYKTKKIE